MKRKEQEFQGPAVLFQKAERQRLPLSQRVIFVIFEVLSELQENSMNLGLGSGHRSLCIAVRPLTCPCELVARKNALPVFSCPVSRHY